MSTAEEIEEITGRPLLAQIPKDDAVVGTASPVVIRPGEFTEAVRALRTGLQFLGVDRPVRRIVVSSAGTGDGKTTVAAASRGGLRRGRVRHRAGVGRSAPAPGRVAVRRVQHRAWV